MVKIALPQSPSGGSRSGGNGKHSHSAGAAASSPPFLFGEQKKADFHVVPWVCLYDHRERAGGWRFGGLTGTASVGGHPLIVPMRETHLVTGDYTIEVPADRADVPATRIPCFIERKSHDDCIGSIGGGHVNLRKEHERFAEILAASGGQGYCCVIVESSLSAICDELESPLSGRRLTPAGVMGVVASWGARYGVHWLFAGDRRTAEMLAYTVLSKSYERWLASVKLAAGIVKGSVKDGK